jgi:DNA-binding beta-propeller fold protein YncE
MLALSTRRTALAALVAACFTASAWAQTVGTPIATGVNPQGVAVNPILNRVYTANGGTAGTANSSVTVVNGANGAVVATLPMGTDFTRWIATDAESGKTYAGGILGSSTHVIGSSNTEIANVDTSVTGWTAINPWGGVVYTLRYGNADEFNWIGIADQARQGTSATRSRQPTAVALNPVTQRLYVVHELTGDIVAMDVSSGYGPYPTLLCPDGAGGFKPQPPALTPPDYIDTWNPDSNPSQHPCIDVPNTPKWVAVNPITNTVYGLSDGAANQISIINGDNHSFTSVTAAGLTGGKVIAVNPLSNKVYALFSNGVAELNAGGGNLLTVIPVSGTPVGIAINTFTNKIYVPSNDGTMKVINGANGTSTVVSIPTGATAVAVNPLTNTVYVTDAGNHVTPVTGSASDVVGPTGITSSITALPANSGGTTGSIAINATSSLPGILGTVRKVWYRIDGGAWTAATPTGTGPFRATYSGLSNGSHTMQAFATVGLEDAAIATDLATAPVLGNVVSYTFNANGVPPSGISVSPTTLNFPGTSMATTSLPATVTVTNSGAGTLSVTGIAFTGADASRFAQTSDCTSLAPSASCTITVTFTPAISPVVLNGTTSASATLVVSSNAPGSPTNVPVTGTAEKSLITHFYEAILRRAPDSGGKSFWADEAARMQGAGADVNEVWYAMSMTFISSPEYQAFNRDNTGFVTDLYKTFFNRAPDQSGMDFWKGQLGAGVPREVVLTSFMLSPEFTSFSQAIFGNTAARAEVNMVMDFYRGLLARLPDSGGFSFWVGQFRTAQCQGQQAVYSQVESISSSFMNGSEYVGRGRTNAQFVGDMYNTFLRRGGEQGGVQFWIDQLNGGTMTRDQVRRNFIASSEFTDRVNAVVNQGCSN